MNDDLNTDDPGQQTGDDGGTDGDVVVDDNNDFRGFESNDDLLADYDKLKAGQPVTPENVEGYTFDPIEGIEVDNEAMTAAKEFALKEGIPAEYFKKFVAFDFERVKAFNDSAPEREKAAAEAAETEAKEKAAEVIETRKAKYGAGYDESIGFQQKALSDFGAGDLVNDPLFANNDMAYDFTVAVGKALSEHKINSGDSQIVSQTKIGEDGKPMMTHKDADKV